MERYTRGSSVNESIKSKRGVKRILLGQLGSFGDCLYATTVAHQIKVDHPNCHLTWAIGSSYRSILDKNPHVDSIWEIPLSKRNDLLSQWQKFEDEALERKKSGDFDKVFFTQVFPGNLKNFDGTLRSSIFRAYPNPITVSVDPVVHLTDNEIDNVIQFVNLHCLGDYAGVVLLESSPKSSQSFVTPRFGIEVSEILVNSRQDICVIISSNEPFRSNSNRIIDGSVLSFRENLKLIDYCDLIVGCSSGVSWLATSTFAKKIPMVQLLERTTFMYASFIHDFEFQKMEAEHILEMTNCPPQKVVDCVLLSFSSDFKTCKKEYGEYVPVKFYYYWQSLMESLLKGRFREVMKSVKAVHNRWGFRGNLITSFFSVYPWLYFPRAIYKFFYKSVVNK